VSTLGEIGGTGIIVTEIQSKHANSLNPTTIEEAMS